MFRWFHLLGETEAFQFIRSMRCRHDDRIRFIAGRIFANARRALSHWLAIRIGRNIGCPRAGSGASQREGRLLVALECGGLEAADRRRSRCSSKQVGCGSIGSASRSGPRRWPFAVDSASDNFTCWPGTRRCSRWIQRVSWCRSRR